MTVRLGLESCKLELALDQPFFDGQDHSADRVWTDFSSRVQSDPPVSIDRGRSDLLADFETGHLSATLQNLDRALDVDNPDSPYWDAERGQSKLRQNTLMRLTQSVLTEGGLQTFGMFYGFTGRLRSSFKAKNRLNYVPLEAWDAFKVLRKTPISTVLPQETTGRRIRRLLTLAGWPPTRSSPPYYFISVGSLGLSLCQALVVDPQQSILELILSAIRTEGPQARAFVNRDGDFVFTDRHAIWLDPILSTVQARFGTDTSSGLLPYQDIDMPDLEGEHYNQVEVSIVSATRGPSVSVAIGGELEAYASLMVIESLKAPLPAGARIDMGSARVITTTEAANPPTGGETLQTVAILPNAAALPTGAQGTYDPNKAIAANNESQALNGKLTLRRSNTLLTSLGEAQALADESLATYLDPPTRFGTLDLSGIADDRVALECAARGFSDRISVDHVPRGGGAVISKELVIEGLRHRIKARSMGTSWTLSLAPPDVGFWLWDDADLTAAVWDVSTVLRF